VSIVFVYKEIT